MLSIYIIIFLPSLFSNFNQLTIAQDTNCSFNQTLSDYVMTRFKPRQIQSLCNRTRKWRSRLNSIPQNGSNITRMLSVNQMNYFTTIQKCRNMTCKGARKLAQLQKSQRFPKQMNFDQQQNDRGRQKRQDDATPLPPSIRKEYRMMTDDERNRWHNAINQLKTDVIDGRSKYDILTVFHTPEYAPGNHYGPAFLPFHREMLRRLESAAREVDPLVASPYWDSRLDQALPNPAHSIIWTEQFLGNGNGQVTSGPFAKNFQIRRNIGNANDGSLFFMTDEPQIMRKTIFNELSFCQDPFFEMIHGSVHLWIGGDMEDLDTSPKDPVFFMVHTFVDFLWEKWRLAKQTMAQRQTDYPSDQQVCNKYHLKNAIMKPFDILNIGGLSNNYTTNLYHYDPTPTCSASQANCGSPYLLCDTRTSRCVAKIRPGGNCTGFSGTFNGCYLGDCINNVCVARTAAQSTSSLTTSKIVVTSTANATPMTSTTTMAAALTTTKGGGAGGGGRGGGGGGRGGGGGGGMPPNAQNEAPPDVVWIPVMVYKQDQNGQQIVKPNVNITITNTLTGVTYQGEVVGGNSTGDSFPYYPGFARAAVANPAKSNGRSQSRITAVSVDDGVQCKAMCFGADGYQNCDGTIVLDANNPSSNTNYTTQIEQAAFLSWKGPAKIPEPVIFFCNSENNQMTTPQPMSSGTTPVFTSRDPVCYNENVCCKVWANTGKCGQYSTFMNATCPKTCGGCIDAKNYQGCMDYFSNCRIWMNNGWCQRNPSWMHENCKLSCNQCNRQMQSLQSQCGMTIRITGCNDSSPQCARLARRGDCRRYKWMTNNCRLSCKLFC